MQVRSKVSYDRSFGSVDDVRWLICDVFVLISGQTLNAETAPPPQPLMTKFPMHKEGPGDFCNKLAFYNKRPLICFNTVK